MQNTYVVLSSVWRIFYANNVKTKARLKGLIHWCKRMTDILCILFGARKTIFQIGSKICHATGEYPPKSKNHAHMVCRFLATRRLKYMQTHGRRRAESSAHGGHPVIYFFLSRRMAIRSYVSASGPGPGQLGV